MLFTRLAALSLSLPILAAGMTPPPQPAQSPQAVVEPADRATVLAAGRLLDAMGYDTMISQMVDKMGAQFGPQMKQSIEAKTGKPANPEMIRRLADAQRRFLVKFTSGPKLRHATELLYAKHFTAAELDRMAVLMRDPVMQRWNARIPEVMTDMLPLITQQIDANGAELKSEIMAIIVEYMGEQGAGSELK